MIYLDTSVVLAHLLAEDRSPPPRLWEESLVSSRLLEYETWVRLNNAGLAASHGELARAILGRVAWLELVPPVLARALEDFPSSVRTLDALHLASADFLRTQGQSIALASYDERLLDAGRRLGIERVDLDA